MQKGLVVVADTKRAAGDGTAERTSRALMVGEHFSWDAEPVRLLRDGGVAVSLLQRFSVTEADLVEAMAAFDPHALVVGIQPVTERVMAAAPSLQVISRYGVGFDKVDVAAATRRRVCVTYEPDSNTVSVAELVFGLMIGAARGIMAAHGGVQAGRWERRPGVELAGKTLGIIGLGRVGQAVARRAVGFEMRVIANDILVDRPFAERWGIAYVSFRELLAQADIVSIHVPLTPLTIRMIGAEALSCMKSGAILINTARGQVVSADAVAEALRSGRLRAAALDVFDQEPTVGSPFLGLPGVVTTPHLGGYTHESLRRMLLGAARSALDVLEGHRPPSPLNPEVLGANL